MDHGGDYSQESIAATVPAIAGGHWGRGLRVRMWRDVGARQFRFQILLQITTAANLGKKYLEPSWGTLRSVPFNSIQFPNFFEFSSFNQSLNNILCELHWFEFFGWSIQLFSLSIGLNCSGTGWADEKPRQSRTWRRACDYTWSDISSWILLQSWSWREMNVPYWKTNTTGLSKKCLL